MPKASVPAVLPPRKSPPPAPLSDAQKEGYNFSNDRWEADDKITAVDNWERAYHVARHFANKGWKAKVYEDVTKGWSYVRQKHMEIEWCRVYFLHPEDDTLYAWWTPLSADWHAEPDPNLLTWFEFNRTKK